MRTLQTSASISKKLPPLHTPDGSPHRNGRSSSNTASSTSKASNSHPAPASKPPSNSTTAKQLSNSQSPIATLKVATAPAGTMATAMNNNINHRLTLQQAAKYDALREERLLEARISRGVVSASAMSTACRDENASHIYPAAMCHVCKCCCIFTCCSAMSCSSAICERPEALQPQRQLAAAVLRLTVEINLLLFIDRCCGRGCR